MRILCLILYVFIFISSCSSTGEETTATANVLSNDSYPELMHRIWQAHGGIENWKSYKAMTFTVTRPGQESSEIHQVNLDDRKVLIQADSFRIGMDGKDVWAAPSLESYEGNPRFYHNLVFYFFNLPFLMADPGVVIEDAGTMVLDGKVYPAARASFEEGTGDADDDDYVLLSDPESGRIEWILYTVTYFVHEKVTTYNALHYQEYMTVDGMKFPGKLSGFEYANNSTGEKRYDIEFKDVSFSADPFAATIFEKPVAGEYSKD